MTPKPQYLYLSVDVFSHPRVLPLRSSREGRDALLTYLQGLAYSQQYLTDGFLPDAYAGQFSAESKARLVKLELWTRVEDDPGPDAEPDIDRCGYMINEFLAYQISRAQWTEEGRKRSERARKAAQKRWASKTDLRIVKDGNDDPA